MWNKKIFLSLIFICWLVGFVYADNKVFQDCQEYIKAGDFSSCQDMITSSDMPVYQKNYLQAYVLFSELKFWQDNKNWPEFFKNKTIYKDKIMFLLEPIHNASNEYKLKSSFLKWKLLVLLEDKDKDKAQDELTSFIDQTLDVDKEFLNVLKEIISFADTLGDKNFKRLVSKSYLESIAKIKDKNLLMSEAENFLKTNDFDNTQVLFNKIISLTDNQEEKKKMIERLIKYFSCDGFKDSCEPYYAEDWFAMYEFLFSQDLGEDLVYLRGFNLEMGLEFQKAADIYVKFIDGFSQSKLLNEVKFRLAYLYFYHLSQEDKAFDLFSELFETDDGFLRNQVLKQKELISKKDFEALDYNSRLFFEGLFSDNEALFNKMRVNAIPARLFVDIPGQIQAVLANLGTGCLVPDVLFLWSGDIAQMNITTNTSSLKSAFKDEGFKIINLVALISGKTEALDSSLINVYRVNVTVDGKTFKPSTSVLFDISIYPYLPKGFVKLSWQITGPKEVSSEDNSFSFSFDQEGNYKGSLEVSFLDRLVLSKEFSFNISSN